MDNLEKELATFNKNKDILLSEKKGRFILIKGDEIVSDFGSYEDALTDGYKRYGNTEFLVKQAVEDETVNFFTQEVIC